MVHGSGAQSQDQLDPGAGWHWKGPWKLSKTALDVYVAVNYHRKQFWASKSSELTFDLSFSPHFRNQDGWQYATNRQSVFKRTTRNAELRRRLWERTAETSLAEQSSIIQEKHDQAA